MFLHGTAPVITSPHRTREAPYISCPPKWSNLALKSGRILRHSSLKSGKSDKVCHVSVAQKVLKSVSNGPEKCYFRPARYHCNLNAKFSPIFPQLSIWRLKIHGAAATWPPQRLKSGKLGQYFASDGLKSGRFRQDFDDFWALKSGKSGLEV